MSRTVSRSTLRTRIRYRADIESASSTDRFPDTELNDAINEALTEVYDLLVASGPPDYYATDNTFSTSANTTSYAFSTIASDFYKLRSVWVDEGNNEFRPISAINEQEMQYVRPPDTVQAMKIRYIPACPTLANDNSTFDGVDGWDELVVLTVAIDCLNKDEQNSSALEAKRQRIEKRIIEMSDRNPGEPSRVIRRASQLQDPYRPYQSTVNAYQVVGGNLNLYRVAGAYLP